MKLSDEDYHNLKKGQVISDAIMMINNIMYRYRSSLEIFKKFGNELSREEFHKKLKVHTSKEERVEKAKKKKIEDIEEADAHVELTESLIEHPIYCDLIGVDIENLRERWLPVFQFSQQMRRENKGRVGPNIRRDAWLEQIILRLKKIGINIQARRIDFVYRLFIEYDWDKYRTYIEGDAEVEYADEGNLRDIIKRMDQKVFSDDNL